VKKKIFIIAGIITLFVVALPAFSQEHEQSTFAGKFKTFWKKLFNYPLRFTEESVNVITDTGKKTVAVVAEEVKCAGDVASGGFSKTKDLVLKPLEGAANTVKYAVEGVIKTPIEAWKDKRPSPAEK